MLEDGDRDIASVSLLWAFVIFAAFGSIITGLVSLIVLKVFPVIGWATFYMPTIIPMELVVLGLSAYLVLVGLCLLRGRGGLLRIRQGVLIYLGIFRFKISDIDHVDFRNPGPYAIKSAVVHLKDDRKRNLSLALADRSLEELQQLAL